MSALCFVDTNVLVYSRDASEPDKQPRAHEWLTALWRHWCGRTSIQVLNEYYVTVTRKLKPGLSEEEAWKDIDLSSLLNPVRVVAANKTHHILGPVHDHGEHFQDVAP